VSDVFTKAKRSEVVSRIRGRGNQDAELALVKLLRRHGIAGWRRQRLSSFVAGLSQLEGEFRYFSGCELRVCSETA